MRDFHQNGRSPVYAANGMAATSMPIASLTAIEVLHAGGNAVDAAVAACAMLAVVEPQSTGIGGDCFCLYAPAGGGKVVAVNGSGLIGRRRLDRGNRGCRPCRARLPRRTPSPSRHRFRMAAAARRDGTKGFDELLQPAIRCAEHGFPVHSRVAWDWSLQVEKLRRAGNSIFLPRGRAPEEGDPFVQTALGGTLRAIAARGADAFYAGPIAADMAATLSARAGRNGRGFRQRPLRRRVRRADPARLAGLDIWQCPPNGPGIVG